MEGPLSRVLIGGTCHSCGSEPPLAQRHIKKGHVGAREPTFTVFIVPPTNPSKLVRSEGAEARGTAHCATATATVVSSTPTPPTPTMTTAAAMSSSSSAQGISK
jgi:hypothetical protein